MHVNKLMLGSCLKNLMQSETGTENVHVNLQKV